MANLYKVAGDYQTALVYLNQGHKFGISRNTGWNMGLEKAEIFRLLQQYDSSFYYLNRLRKNDPENPNIKLDIGATFLLTNQIDSALGYLKPALAYFRKRYYSGLNFGNEILISSLLYMGRACEQKPIFRGYVIYKGRNNNDSIFRNQAPDNARI